MKSLCFTLLNYASSHIAQFIAYFNLSGLILSFIGSILLALSLNTVILLLVASSNRVDHLIRTNGQVQFHGFDKKLKPAQKKSNLCASIGLWTLSLGFFLQLLSFIMTFSSQ